MHNFGKARLVERGVTNWPVTATGMWGYTPVQITGVLYKIERLILLSPYQLSSENVYEILARAQTQYALPNSVKFIRSH